MIIDHKWKILYDSNMSYEYWIFYICENCDIRKAVAKNNHSLSGQTRYKLNKGDFYDSVDVGNCNEIIMENILK